MTYAVDIPENEVPTLLEQGPWPGPRPFRTEEARWLFGRDDDVRTILRRLSGFKVLVFHAESGVGKSSVLHAGVVPRLKEMGRPTVLCEWGPGSGGNEHAFYALALQRGLIKARDAFPEAAAIELKVDDAAAYIDACLEELSAGDQMYPVIVFDQVEELMRRDKDLAARFLDVVSAIAVDKKNVSQIITLRSEYAYQVSALEKKLGPMKLLTAWELPVLQGEQLLEVITEPAARFTEETGRKLAVSRETAAQLVRWWELARQLQSEARRSEESTSDTGDLVALFGGSSVGLLHLQAVLDETYQLWRSEGEPPTGVDEALLDQLCNIVAPRPEGESEHSEQRMAARLLVDSLQHYVARVITTTGRSVVDTWTESEELRTFLEALVIRAAARMAQSLSSGGYKVALEVGDLVKQAVGNELQPLGLQRLAEASAQQLILHDKKKSDPEALALVTTNLDGPASGQNQKSLVAGPARRLGLSREQTGAALLLAACAATKRMERGAILKKAPTTGDAVYELVHDGFGPALISWAESVLSGPRMFIDSPSAILGLDIRWENDEADAIDGEIGFVRWIGGWTGTYDGSRFPIKGVVFRRADLKGSIFQNVDFDKVEFVDCELNGVLFDRCKMRNVTFCHSAERSAEIERSYDMLTFREVAGLDNESVAVRFSNISMKNVSVENCFGLWKVEAGSTLSQVSLSGPGQARFEGENANASQWRVDERWLGDIAWTDGRIELTTIVSNTCQLWVHGETELTNNNIPRGRIRKEKSAPDDPA